MFVKGGVALAALLIERQHNRGGTERKEKEGVG